MLYESEEYFKSGKSARITFFNRISSLIYRPLRHIYCKVTSRATIHSNSSKQHNCRLKRFLAASILVVSYVGGMSSHTTGGNGRG